MGCCVSSNKALTSSLEFVQPTKPSQSNRTSFQVEEEKVKQVLSETPKLNPKTSIIPQQPKPHQNITPFYKVKEEKIKVNEKKTNDTSEVCSLSKTMPTTTKEETGKRVDRSPVKLNKNRSFSGEIGGRREKPVHGTSRNFGSVRLIQCRDQAGQKMVNETMRRRRDPGENSFRRARSPATCADTLGRSPSARRMNRPPVARDRTVAPEKGRRKTEIPAMVGNKRSYANNESLENPLVSLECFIFI